MFFNQTGDPQKLFYPSLCLKKANEAIGFPCLSPALKEQPDSRLFMQIPTAMLSRLKCDIKLHQTQEEISFSFSSQGCCMLKRNAHQKLCRTLQSLRKLNVCLWKFDMHVCALLIPHFLQCFVCQESSKECPHFPRCISQDITSTLLHRPLFCI